MIVLDSSAAADYVLGYEPAEWVADEVRGAEHVHAPHLLDVEVTAALRRQVHAGLVSARRAGQAISDFEDMRVRRYPHRPFLRRMWQLRENLTASDAAFVALTEVLRVPLVTTDLRLARTPGLAIEIRTPPNADL